MKLIVKLGIVEKQLTGTTMGSSVLSDLETGTGWKSSREVLGEG